jgi:hypothetical protein
MPEQAVDPSGSPTEPLATAPTAPAPHKRHWTINAIFVLAVIVGVFAVLAVWVNRQVLNTDNWTNTSSRLLADPKVQTAVGDLLVNELFSQVDLGSRRARRARRGRAADARDADRTAGARDLRGPERVAHGQPHRPAAAARNPQRRQQDDLDEQR